MKWIFGLLIEISSSRGCLWTISLQQSGVNPNGNLSLVKGCNHSRAIFDEKRSHNWLILREQVLLSTINVALVDQDTTKYILTAQQQHR